MRHTISRVENEKGLCAYILYMHIAPFNSQLSICQAKKSFHREKENEKTKVDENNNNCKKRSHSNLHVLQAL